MIRENLIEVLHEMEEVTKLFKLDSKIIRLAEKDIEDLNQIMPKCNKELINRIINEILDRDDLFESKKNEFIKKLKVFREKYNV